MEFLRNRVQQLTDYMREQIRGRRLVEPLPHSREWAAQLGVSCTTLYAALHNLQREKLIVVRPRQGMSLARVRRGKGPRAGRKIVRLVYRGLDFPGSSIHADWFEILARLLQSHDIQLLIERCTDSRLQALGGSSLGGEGPRELLFLRSVSEKYQRLFSRSERPALIIGYCGPGVSLPNVTTDLEGAIRHSVNRFIRAGIRKIDFLINRSAKYAIELQCETFAKSCAAWSGLAIQGGIFRVPLEPSAQLKAIRNFAARFKPKRGVIVMPPVSHPAVMTALLGRQVAIPQMAEICVINSTATSPIVSPPPIEYRVSAEAYAKALMRMAVHFFATGRLPAMGKTVSLELIVPPVNSA